MSNLETLQAQLAEMKTPLIASQNDAAALQDYLEKFSSNEVMIAGFMGWNTAINVVLAIVDQHLNEQ